MRDKQSHLHFDLTAGDSLDEEFRESGKFDASQIRAKGLARLLIYAAHDALEFGGNDIAAALIDVIEQIKTEYRLADPDILPPGVEDLN